MDKENHAVEWELDQESDDVRGWPVRDRAGNSLGRVRSLLVDTDTHYIVEVVLDDGTHVPARELVIGDRILTLQVPAPPLVDERMPMPQDSLRPIDVQLPRGPATTAAGRESRRGRL